MSDKKHTHLGMIQAIVNRLSSNSFMLKGWTVLLVSALFVFLAKDKNLYFIILSLLPVISFWLLDGYYLWQERLFRSLYDYVRLLDEDEINYSMDISITNKPNITWKKILFLKNNLGFLSCYIYFNSDNNFSSSM